ncbi:MAG: hypothetical protein K6E93_04610 [Bacteroidales bacterium]|nr:hypothetical protein [Bacteroidales bacterium]
MRRTMHIVWLLLGLALVAGVSAQEPSRRDWREMQRLYADAYRYQRDYKPGEAMRCLRRLLEMDSTLVVAHNLMGYIYEDAYANYDSAMVCYRRAVALDSHFVKGYVNIGHLYYLDRKYEEANEYNRRALAIDSNYADAYFNLGWMANEQNYLHEAFGFMRKAAAKGSKAAREWLEKQEE